MSAARSGTNVLLSIRMNPRGLSLMVHSASVGGFSANLFAMGSQGLQLGFTVDGDLKEHEIEVTLPFAPLYAGFTQLDLQLDTTSRSSARKPLPKAPKRLVDLRKVFQSGRTNESARVANVSTLGSVSFSGVRSAGPVLTSRAAYSEYSDYSHYTGYSEYSAFDSGPREKVKRSTSSPKTGLKKSANQPASTEPSSRSQKRARKTAKKTSK